MQTELNGVVQANVPEGSPRHDGAKRLHSSANGFASQFDQLFDKIEAISNGMQASQAVAIDAEIVAITKDLDPNAANTYLALPLKTTSIGSIYDGTVNPIVQKREVLATLSESDFRRLGRQTVFAVNAVDLVITSPVSIPAASPKQTNAKITTVYADQILETSAGT